MRYLMLIIFPLVVLACGTPKPEQTGAVDTPIAPEKNKEIVLNDDLAKIEKTADEWKAELNDEEYYILREKGTERAFTGDLWNHKEKGIYTCRGCQLPLFHSDTKFKSGTGWPSYYQPIKEGHVAEEKDFSYGMKRVEVLCGRCDGHLGHVFDDGPAPTGLRYCINSASLDFVKE